MQTMAPAARVADQPDYPPPRWIYDFADGGKQMRGLLGGKGANIAEMTCLLGADLVPAGFTITTEACVEYMRTGHEPEGLGERVSGALERLERRAAKRFGDERDPLLLSVRSGARESMPGMLDTILNLGLNDRSVRGLAAATGNPRFAWDSYRRLLQMFGTVVHGAPGHVYELALGEARHAYGVRSDAELPMEALVALVERFEVLSEFPQDPRQQLQEAIPAVFDSWSRERAIEYRRINGIPDDWGTAVSQRAADGVRQHRRALGDWGRLQPRRGDRGADAVRGLPCDAQGEDVVSGVRTPRELSELTELMPEAYAQLTSILQTLEAHFRDMQDTEFTVQEGRLYMLQTRNAKRPAQAAVRFAVDAVDEGLLSREEALATIDAQALDALFHPTFDRAHGYHVLARGVAASPGAACGQIVFSAATAVAAAAEGRSVILDRQFTEADDVAGFHAASGILTAEGGKASHAALVARGMGVPAVTGAATPSTCEPASSASMGEASERATRSHSTEARGQWSRRAR
jgi:pyruvate, orthophosphate dikinase